MIDQRKKELRNLIKVKKKQYSLEQKKSKSSIIFNKLENLDIFKNSRIIMAYWSMSDEVFTHDFVLKWYKEKQFILPVVKGDDLELRLFRGKEYMVKGESFGIEEPVGESFTRVEDIDIVIVPGVAFDKENNRLGRGKAYYDKLLIKSNALKLGVCFDFQYLNEVPTDGHDIKMDLILHD